MLWMPATIDAHWSLKIVPGSRMRYVGTEIPTNYLCGGRRNGRLRLFAGSVL